jgi:hypothetical protein
MSVVGGKDHFRSVSCLIRTPVFERTTAPATLIYADMREVDLTGENLTDAKWQGDQMPRTARPPAENNTK